MDEIPCIHLLAEQGPVCYQGRNTTFECTCCSSYDWHPAPTKIHWEVWSEIKRSGVATRSDADNNPGGQARL